MFSRGSHHNLRVYNLQSIKGYINQKSMLWIRSRCSNEEKVTKGARLSVEK